jgi:excisionase family DNA binding protein
MNQWIGTREACGQLGVTLQTLYGYIDEGLLPAYKVGRIIRLRTDDLAAFNRDDAPHRAARTNTTDYADVPSDVEQLVNDLASVVIGSTFNQYAGDDGAGRRDRLRSYLTRHWYAPLLLVGEAAGYKGCRLTGIPFTSPRQLGIGGTGEAASTIVHQAIADLGITNQVLMWNAVPTHPHQPGNPLKNRAPTAAERTASRSFNEVVRRGREVVAVGRHAHMATGAPYVRHPSNGGKAQFRQGLLEFVTAWRIRSGGVGCGPEYRQAR